MCSFLLTISINACVRACPSTRRFGSHRGPLCTIEAVCLICFHFSGLIMPHNTAQAAGLELWSGPACVLSHTSRPRNRLKYSRVKLQTHVHKSLLPTCHLAAQKQLTARESSYIRASLSLNSKALWKMTSYKNVFMVKSSLDVGSFHVHPWSGFNVQY